VSFSNSAVRSTINQKRRGKPRLFWFWLLASCIWLKAANQLLEPKDQKPVARDRQSEVGAETSASHSAPSSRPRGYIQPELAEVLALTFYNHCDPSQLPAARNSQRTTSEPGTFKLFNTHTKNFIFAGRMIFYSDFERFHIIHQ
jgi:hypothetical protein